MVYATWHLALCLTNWYGSCGTKNKNGIYFFMGKKEGEGECSTAKDTRALWKTVWELHVRPVMKNLLWKVCNSLLPTKENLLP